MAWNLAPASWSAAVLCRFGWGKLGRISNPVKKQSGRGQPHSKTLARFRMRMSIPNATKPRRAKQVLLVWHLLKNREDFLQDSIC